MLQSPFNYIPKEKKRKSNRITNTITSNKSSSNNSQIDICNCSSTTPNTSHYDDNDVSLLLHTPPPSTHKHHQQFKKQRLCNTKKTDLELRITPTRPSAPATPNTPIAVHFNCADDYCNTTIGSSVNNANPASISSTPTTPPMEICQEQQHQRHYRQVTSPPPTTSYITTKEMSCFNHSEDNSKFRRHSFCSSSLIETKLKLIQVKLGYLEDSAAKDDVTELVQSTIDELKHCQQEQEKEIKLPKRKYDEFIITTHDLLSVPENQGFVSR
ncbi:hypothetical protein CANMA_000842 [Candida margitis]|uniref:uncharacterized protein n=1 Tax=Candida margitis TaxID=1775924 RepID=UPI0022267925|nr:uncharacterized protein CANMA_000842 [Candida margitis]KAI5970230.1 hypothetical protein CANMA_000842 [Candida margitis]